MKQFSISRTVIECISTHLKLASDFVKASCQALIFFFFQQSPHSENHLPAGATLNSCALLCLFPSLMSGTRADQYIDHKYSSMTSSSACVLEVRLSCSLEINLALPRLHGTVMLQRPFTQPATVLNPITSLGIMAQWVHMLCSMCMHSCLNTCLREKMCLNCVSARGCMHACIYVNAPVYVSDCFACLSPPKGSSHCGSASVCECV